jgi:molybdopterin molybdotransferase
MDRPPCARIERLMSDRRLLSVSEATEMVLGRARRSLGTEIVPLSKANGRVLANDVFARIAHPPFDRSAVDGYGIGKDDIHRQAPFALCIIGKICAGDDPSTMQINDGATIRLATGAPVPSSVAGIVMEEHCSSHDCTITFLRGASPSENIRLHGEDVSSGGIIARRGTTLDARHIAMLAAVGHSQVRIANKTRISILSTGNELTESSRETSPGTIFDSNRPMLMALLAKHKVKLCDAGLCSDDPERLATVLRAEAERSDLIITSGAAAGSETDHLAKAVRLAGGTAEHHHIALKPGKPLLAGAIGNTHYLGLPGNPVAAMVTALLFGRPLIDALSGSSIAPLEGEWSVAAERIPHRIGRREFAPGRVVGQDADGQRQIVKSGRGGSASLLPLVLADGLIDLSAQGGDIDAGSLVRFHPFGTLM